MIDSPNASERTLVWRLLMREGELIGSEDEVWTHHLTWRALGTLRECIDGIERLHRMGLAVRPSFVSSYVMQADGLAEAPYLLDAMAEFLCEDSEARRYWDSQIKDDMFPHECVFCGSAAYIGYLQVSCKSRCPASKTR